MTKPNTTIEPVSKDTCTFVPSGEADAITLSLSIVRRNFCKPTKSGQQPSDQDVMSFLMTCRSQRLNPFLGDAWLTGYDAKDGPQFSVLVSQRVLLKRAELHPQFDGIESGITVETESGNVDLQTEIIPSNTKLVGAWARVYRKDRSRHVYKQIPFAGYRKETRFWNDNPAGMITKCAESDALRFAFPSVNGGLYTQEEGAPIDIGAIANQVRIVETPQATLPAPTETSPQPSVPLTPQEEVADIVTGAGYTFDQFKRWAIELGQLQADAPVDSFGDMQPELARRLARAKAGMVRGIKELVEAK